MLKYNPISGVLDDAGSGIPNTDPLLSSTQEIRVKLNPGIGEFSSIAAALASITTNSDLERYVIKVSPGVYKEPLLDFASKPFVSLVGESIQSVVIQPDGPHHIMTLGQLNEVSFVWLEGAQTGYAAMSVVPSADYSQAHKVTFNNCDIGIQLIADTGDNSFYGEYLDMNGVFTYGVLVEGNNGFLAFANLENFYILPVGAATLRCGIRVEGAGSDVDLVTVGMMGETIGNGIEVVDGADLLLNGVYIEKFDKGLWNENSGNPVSIKCAATQFLNNVTSDIEVLQPATAMGLIGVATHAKIISNTPNFIHGYIDPSTGEYEVSNKLSVTFDDGTHTDLSTLVFEGSSMGVLSGGDLTDGGGLFVDVASGSGYLDDASIVKRYGWNASTLALTANADNSIFINGSGTLTASVSTPTSLSNVIYLGRVRTNSTGVEFVDSTKMNSHHLGNLLSTFNRVALGNIYVSGSTITEGTALKLNITAGLYFRSEIVITPSGGTDVLFTQYHHNGSSAWVKTSTDTVNNTHYNSGTTYTPLTTAHFTKHALYTIGKGVNEQYFLVLGQSEYPTLLLAQSGTLPSPPSYFDKGVTLIGLIYVQEGVGNIVSIDDARPVIGFKPVAVAGSSDHGSLTGLGDDDHAQYVLTSGGRTMTGNLDLGTNNIINVGLVDGVDVSTHASRHLPNGADPLTTAAPPTNLGGSSTNATGNANSLSRSNHSHAIDIANTSTTGLITSTDWNTFDSKLSANTPISGATKTKITYDTKGLVTAGADATTADIADSTNKRYVTDANLVVIGNTSNTNTGDQTTIVGITGTKSQFDTACTDGDFLYVGNITQYTDELAQDAVGAMIDTSLVYVDATPLLTRAALTGDVTASQGSNATTIANSAVTLTKMADVPTGTIFYRTTAGTGSPEVQTLSTLKTDLGLTGTNSGDQTITLTGDVTGTGTGSFAVTVSKLNGTLLSGLATGILKNTTGTGVPSIAVAGDFPTLNQNTTGTASAWSTGRTISTTGDVTYTSGSLNGTANVTGTATIASTAVTFAKIQNVNTGILIGRSTASTGSVEEVTIGTGLSLSGGILTATGLGISSVNAAGNITTTSATDTPVTTITLTPGAGTYLALFSSDISHDTNTGTIQVSLYANAVLAPNSTRTYIRGNQTQRVTVFTQAVITVTAGQAIDVRWNRGASGIGTMGNRSLILIKQ